MPILSRQEEFNRIYIEHYNSLCRSAYRILNEKESAREIVQQVFLELWNRGNWDGIQSLKAYLHVAVHNRSLNFLNQRKKFVSEDLIQEQSAEQASGIEEEELRNAILGGIASLPEKCREIFLLSREEEMTYQQIADHLGLSVKTVERQMGIALSRLRQHLDIYLSG